MEWARQFSLSIKQCEKDEIHALREWMREKKKKALQQCFWNTNQKFQDELRGISRSVVRAAMEAVLRKRFNAVTASYAFFRSRNCETYSWSIYKKAEGPNGPGPACLLMKAFNDRRGKFEQRCGR